MNKIPRVIMKKEIIEEEKTGNGVLYKNPIRLIDENISEDLNDKTQKREKNNLDGRKDRDKSTISEKDLEEINKKKSNSRFANSDNSLGKKEGTGTNSFKESENENDDSVAKLIKNGVVVDYN